MHDRYLMKDMVPLHLFLGLEISKDASGIKLSQAKYARYLLERFHMTDCKSTLNPFLSGVKLEDGRETPLVDNKLYRQLVGSLLYLTHSKPYLSYAIGAVSRFMQEPRELHWKAAKLILRYVGNHHLWDSLCNRPMSIIKNLPCRILLTATIVEVDHSMINKSLTYKTKSRSESTVLSM